MKLGLHCNMHSCIYAAWWCHVPLTCPSTDLHSSAGTCAHKSSLAVAVLLCECVQGVSQVSQMVQYPADPSIDTPPVWVAHFAHPIEVEWVARAVPAPKDWPRLLLQVGPAHPLPVGA
jgi:hypothetical protein